MKVLVDTNILLDVALQRDPHLADSDGAVRWCESHPGDAFIAWHSVSNSYYLLAKRLDDASARDFIKALLDMFEVAEQTRRPPNSRCTCRSRISTTRFKRSRRSPWARMSSSPGTNPTMRDRRFPHRPPGSFSLRLDRELV